MNDVHLATLDTLQEQQRYVTVLHANGNINKAASSQTI